MSFLSNVDAPKQPSSLEIKDILAKDLLLFHIKDAVSMNLESCLVKAECLREKDN